MPDKFINIKFPFKDSPQGFYFDLSKTNNEAIKSDLLHLILTTKDYEEIRVGDFIVAENWAGRFFHQVVEVRDGEKGKVFMTRGISNTEDDVFPVFSEQVIGVAIAVIW